MRMCGRSCPGTHRYGFTRQLKESCYQALCNLRGNLAAGCIRLALESFLIYRDLALRAMRLPRSKSRSPSYSSLRTTHHITGCEWRYFHHSYAACVPGEKIITLGRCQGFQLKL